MHRKPSEKFQKPKKKKTVPHSNYSIRIPTDRLTKIKKIADKCDISPNALICEILAWGVQDMGDEK